jgi:hypothetical protein
MLSKNLKNRPTPTGSPVFIKDHSAAKLSLSNSRLSNPNTTSKDDGKDDERLRK